MRAYTQARTDAGVNTEVDMVVGSANSLSQIPQSFTETFTPLEVYAAKKKAKKVKPTIKVTMSGRKSLRKDIHGDGKQTVWKLPLDTAQKVKINISAKKIKAKKITGKVKVTLDLVPREISGGDYDVPYIKKYWSKTVKVKKGVAQFTLPRIAMTNKELFDRLTISFTGNKKVAAKKVIQYLNYDYKGYKGYIEDAERKMLMAGDFSMFKDPKLKKFLGEIRQVVITETAGVTDPAAKLQRLVEWECKHVEYGNAPSELWMSWDDDKSFGYAMAATTYYGKKGVCFGYTLLFWSMANFIVPTIPVYTNNHDWTIVEVNDVWYHVDPTWVDGDSIGYQSPVKHYGWFLTTDAVMQQHDVNAPSHHANWKVGLASKNGPTTGIGAGLEFASQPYWRTCPEIYPILPDEAKVGSWF
ncbi:MAG: hypothetical protein LBK50_00685 [Candidatus Nomurabacteria bacterium]|nr:hypothetical protein [Candidatus Nomurabacteria bacterium]